MSGLCTLIIMKTVIFACLLAGAAAIPIDNGVQGDPEIECGSNSIQVGTLLCQLFVLYTIITYLLIKIIYIYIQYLLIWHRQRSMVRLVQVTFNTQNNFEGHVYVKGLYDQKDQGCRTTGYFHRYISLIVIIILLCSLFMLIVDSGDSQRAVGSIELPFDRCNVQRERSANPKGIFVRTTVVINFHPNFITKVDRAYTLQCFYMEADKTVSADIEVRCVTKVM